MKRRGFFALLAFTIGFDWDGVKPMFDTNGDGKIDIVDVNWFHQNYNDPLVQWLSHVYDFNGDGKVDIIDVNKSFQAYEKAPRGEEIAVDIYQTKALTEHFERGPYTKLTAAEVAKKYIAYALNPIPGKSTNIRIQGTVDIDLSDNYSADLDNWEEYLEDDQIPEGKTDAQILLAKQDESVGGVAIPTEPEASICYDSHYLINAQDSIPIAEFSWNYAHATAVNAVHEVGHNLGLNHLDGSGSIITGSKFVPDGKAVGTAMIGIYLATGEYRGEENNAGDVLPGLENREDYYITPHFSENAMEQIAKNHNPEE